MNVASKRLRKILAVIDDSPTQIALDSAVALADRHDAKLEAFACIEPPRDLSVLARLAGRNVTGLIDDLRERARETLSRRIASRFPDRAIDLKVAVGKTFVEIVQHVMAENIDFVVKASEPLSPGRRFFFTSTDQHLMRKCPCPVWLQTSDARPAPQCVIAAVDVDVWDADEPETLRDVNRRVIETACQVAAADSAEVIVLHAWDATAEGMAWAFSSGEDKSTAVEAYVNEIFDTRHRAINDLLADHKASRSPSDDVPVFPSLVRGTPERVIEQQSRELEADVVVMGTVARTGLNGLFIGHTAENIINSLQCPILAVKPAGFISPLARH